MSIELNRRVKDLEAKLAEVNRQIAELTVNKANWPAHVPVEERIASELRVTRKPGRPRKDEQRTTG
jgi:hypothetical protein